MIEIAGRKDVPGKPLIYVTSGTFMEYFGIHGVEDLPQLKDFKEEENQVGEQADIQMPEVTEAEEVEYPYSELPQRTEELGDYRGNGRNGISLRGRTSTGCKFERSSLKKSLRHAELDSVSQSIFKGQSVRS